MSKASLQTALKKASRSMLTVILLLLAIFILCWPGGPPRLHWTSRTNHLSVRRKVTNHLMAREHVFIPAGNPDIHYAGRWTTTLNRLRRDAAFNGAYIDLLICNTSSLYLSLHNSPATLSVADGHASLPRDRVNPRHILLQTPIDDKSAEPVALLVRVNASEYLHFPRRVHGLVVVNTGTFSATAEHRIRITHLTDLNSGASEMQFEGVWLSKGGFLLPLSSPTQTSRPSPLLSPDQRFSVPFRKTIEIVTDHQTIEKQIFREPDNTAFSNLNSAVDTVSSWESQLGGLFGADHVIIPTFRQALAERSSNTQANAAPLLTAADLFFRSGPVGSVQFSRPWPFHSNIYTPSVVILDLGPDAFNTDASRSTRAFEDAYISFIHSLRVSAYPVHPAYLHAGIISGVSTDNSYTYNSAPSTIPIFVLRPFDGALEHATQRVVSRVRKEDGDKSVFWIDTTGWLEESDWLSQPSDPRGVGGQGVRVGRKTWTTGANRKIAIFLHMHLCHYLADEAESCPFDRHDDYLGDVYVPSEAEVDKVIEEAKTKRIRELFWGAEMRDM